MPIHVDEHCNCPHFCVYPECDHCFECCPDHAGQCGECGCNDVSGFVNDECDCDCHVNIPSDASERQAERRQMGINE